MKKVNSIIAGLVISLLLSFCEKQSQSQRLPDVTTEGKNTMGFLVDGKVWVAYSGDFKKSKTEAAISPLRGMVINGVNHYNKTSMDLILSLPSKGAYQFNSQDLITYLIYTPAKEYTLDPSSPGNNLIIMRYDTNVVSGTFSFSLKAPDGSVVKITEGRFDIGIR